jgi:hypothetical protein
MEKQRREWCFTKIIRNGTASDQLMTFEGGPGGGGCLLGGQ